MILTHVQLYGKVKCTGEKETLRIQVEDPKLFDIAPLAILFGCGSIGDHQTAAMIDALHEARRLSGYAVHVTQTEADRAALTSPDMQTLADAGLGVS